MMKLNSLHLRIAEILIDYATKQETINYADLCEEINYPSMRTIGKELGKLSEFTYEKYGIFISVLVVLKETQGTPNPIPGTGFYKMYLDVCGKKDVNLNEIVISQREMAFKQDWSELPELIRREINFNAD